jgi:threonine/homoserine/homoserine lactone efflux protein
VTKTAAAAYSLASPDPPPGIGSVMSNVQLLAFIAASVLIVVVPGVDFALVTRQTVKHGVRGGFITLGGLVVGALTHVGLATAGLSALLASSSTAYTVLRIAGALYIGYIGTTILLATRNRAPVPEPVPAGAAGGPDAAADDRAVPVTPDEPISRSFRMGIMSNLLNPKVILFYVSFVPQFIDPGSGAASRTAFLGCTFVGIAIVWWSLYILLIERLHNWLTKPLVTLWIERSTGIILLALALKLAVGY